MKSIYGVEHALQKKEFLEKSKNTKMSLYGDENYNNIKQVKETCLRKYGVDNVRKSTVVVDEANKTVLDNHFAYLVKLCVDNGLEMLCGRSGYVGYHFTNLYSFRCLKCKNEFTSSVYHLSSLYCNKCDPDRRLTLEGSFFDFLKTVVPSNVEIKRRDRSVLNGKELDFYIPFKGVAFEMNGLYWHSELGGGIGRMYHLNKTKNCLFHSVRLTHILESEWLSNRDIVMSVVKSTLGYQPNKIYGRVCEVRDVSIQEKDDFLNKNHLQGKDKSTVKTGLYFNDELVSIMTFRKTSRFDKNVEWELSRFCNKINYTIIGGASKLFSSFVKNYNPKTVVSYSDRRYFTGDIYGKLGFKFVSQTSPGYHYLTDKYKGIKNRMSFQKHKLKKILPVFDVRLSEWENMKNNGFDRIWDCGNTKWVFKSSDL
jgi:hypothetical protein